MNSAKTQWSNKTGENLRIRSNWQELCIKCHAHYDRVYLGRGFGRKARVSMKVIEPTYPVEWVRVTPVDKSKYTIVNDPYIATA